MCTGTIVRFIFHSVSLEMHQPRDGTPGEAYTKGEQQSTAYDDTPVASCCPRTLCVKHKKMRHHKNLLGREHLDQRHFIDLAQTGGSVKHRTRDL